MQFASTVFVATLVGVAFAIGTPAFLVIWHARILRDLAPEERLRIRSWRRLKKARPSAQLTLAASFKMGLQLLLRSK
jgi:hypothetical protein